MVQMEQAWRDLQTRDASAEDSVCENRAGMRSHNENLRWYLHVLLTSCRPPRTPVSRPTVAYANVLHG